MKKLKLVGAYKELTYSKQSKYSIYENMNFNYAFDIKKLINYLDNGTLICAAPNITFDVLSETQIVIGTNAFLTDGTWYWHADLTYYLKKYSIYLPKEFIDYCISKNWTINEIDITSFDFELGV